MRLLVLSAAIAATVLGALPAAAEIVIRAGEAVLPFMNVMATVIVIARSGGVIMPNAALFGGSLKLRAAASSSRHAASANAVRLDLPAIIRNPGIPTMPGFRIASRAYLGSAKASSASAGGIMPNTLSVIEIIT